MTQTPAPLTDAQVEAWRTMVPALLVLPGALDSQLQRDHDLTYPAYLALSTLYEADGGALRMRILAGRASMSMSRLSHLADRLEASGYLVRRRVEGDRRSTLAVLTDSGRAKVEEAMPTHTAGVRTLVFERLTAAQVRQLQKIFSVISSRIDPEDRVVPALR